MKIRLSSTASNDQLERMLKEGKKLADDLNDLLASIEQFSGRLGNTLPYRASPQGSPSHMMQKYYKDLLRALDDDDIEEAISNIADL